MNNTTPYFDCDARERALTPPILLVGGIRYGGQILSIVEWLPFLERYEELQRRQAAHQAAIATNREMEEQKQDLRPRVPVPPAPALREVLAFYAEFLRAVFPRELRPRWWMRGFGSTYDPVSRLERAPDPAVLSEAFAVFFGRQLRAMQGQHEPLEAEPSETRETAGTSSPASTTPAPSDAPAIAPSA